MRLNYSLNQYNLYRSKRLSFDEMSSNIIRHKKLNQYDK